MIAPSVAAACRDVNGAWMFVTTAPGATALQRMPCALEKTATGSVITRLRTARAQQPDPRRTSGGDHWYPDGYVLKLLARQGAPGQATWTERIELPSHRPSMAVVAGASGSVAAPSVSSSGT